MLISQQEASSALRDVELTQARSRDAYAYRTSSNHLFLWGGVWIVGYTGMGLLPSRDWGLLWLILDLIGAGGALLLVRKIAAAGHASSRRWFGAFGAIFLFIVATYWVMGPFEVAQYQMYPVLVLALVYALAGTWRLPRYLWIGGVILTLALLGYAFLRPWLPYWLALAGGGGLVLGGFWLRRV